ncbi:MAG: GNAT family N-acetyltransferase, partial [Peptostreptococcaceae bacterium]
MIIKLDSSYHSKVMRYLEKESEFNLLIIGDIERYGYDNYFFSLWAGINKEEEIEGILVKCFEFIIFYAYDKFDENEFVDLIKTMEYSEISGKSDVVDKLAYKLNLSKNRKVNFCKLENGNLLKCADLNLKIKKMRFRHLNKVTKLYESIDEFENATVENIRSGLKTGRGYFIE